MKETDDETGDKPMTRKLRPLSEKYLGELPSRCSTCVFWESAENHDRVCGSVCDGELLRTWYRTVSREWGECGRVAISDGEVIGFVKYGPVWSFPQSLTFAAQPDPAEPLIACLHVRNDARQLGLGKVLLHAVLRDLVTRGEKRVQVFGCAQSCDVDSTPMPGVDFLVGQGFLVRKPDPTYPLLGLELRAMATWTENLEAALEALRLPRAAPRRVVSPSIK